MEEDILTEDPFYPSKDIPDSSNAVFAPLRSITKTVTTGGDGGGHSAVQEETEEDLQEYTYHLLRDSPYLCLVCLRSVCPSKEMTVQPFCSCGRAYRYHLSCFKRTAFFYDAFEKMGCLHCFKEKARKDTETQKKLADRQIRSTIVMPPITSALKAKFLTALGESGYEQGYFSVITNLISKKDDETVSRDFTLATQDSYLYEVMKERVLTYDHFHERGFTIPMLVALCPNLEHHRVFLLNRLRICQSKVIDFIHSAPIAFEAGATPNNLRFSGFTLDRLIEMNPSAKELISGGFHVGELLLLGFKKQHLAAFPRVSIVEFIEIIGFSYDNMILLGIEADDFHPNEALGHVNKAAMATALKINVNSVEGIKLGLCKFADDEKPRRFKNGIPELD